MLKKYRKLNILYFDSVFPQLGIQPLFCDLLQLSHLKYVLQLYLESIFKATKIKNYIKPC